MTVIVLYSQLLLVAVLLLLFWIWQKYGARAIFHPFSIFLVTWVPSFAAVPAFAAINYDRFFFDEEAVVELFTFFSFTLASIIFSMLFMPVRARYRRLNIDIDAPRELLGWLALFLLLVAAIEVVISGAIDTTAARDRQVQTASLMQETGRATVAQSLISLSTSLSVIVLLFSGKEVINKLAYGSKYRLPSWAIMAFVAVVISTVAGGGRAAIIRALITVSVGAALFYNFQAPLKSVARRGLITIAIVFSLFAAYATFVAELRFDRQGYSRPQIFEAPALRFLNGVMEYSFFHILGYQYRMNDAFSDKPNGLGGGTFGFLTNLNLPFASQIGRETSLGSVLGIEKPPGQTVTVGLGITATVYFNLHDDLGYYGTFVAILLFSLFTQYLFKWVITRRIRHVTSFAVFLLVYGLWTDSWFHHRLGNIKLVSAFVPFIVFELLVVGYRRLKGPGGARYLATARWEGGKKGNGVQLSGSRPLRPVGGRPPNG